MSGIDLGDLYRGELTLRQVWVRLRALPGDSAVHRSISDRAEKAEAEKAGQDVMDALAMFGKEA